MTRTQTITGKSPQYLKPSDIVSGIGSGSAEIPQDLLLDQNYPNPFNPTTVIRYALPQAGSVTLSVFTPTGAQVAVLVRGEQDARTHQVTFDATGLSSGIYFYRLTVGGRIQTRKLLLLK